MEFVRAIRFAILKRDGKLDVETALKVLHQTAGWPPRTIAA